MRQIDGPNVADEPQSMWTREIFRCKRFAHQAYSWIMLALPSVTPRAL